MVAKKEEDKIEELLISIRNLLILQLHSRKVPIKDIVKASRIYNDEIYKFIPKTKTKQKTPKKSKK